MRFVDALSDEKWVDELIDAEVGLTDKATEFFILASAAKAHQTATGERMKILPDGRRLGCAVTPDEDCNRLIITKPLQNHLRRTSGVDDTLVLNVEC